MLEYTSIGRTQFNEREQKGAEIIKCAQNVLDKLIVLINSMSKYSITEGLLEEEKEALNNFKESLTTKLPTPKRMERLLGDG